MNPHPNILRFLGHGLCVDGDTTPSPCLVYEYMVKGSLYSQIITEEIKKYTPRQILKFASGIRID